ncbi:MAG: photosystem I assembly protein Ycf4, partial [Cyanobacteria bacterium SW_9_47_5]
MTAQATTQNDRVLRQGVLGSRRFSNYLWAIVSSAGGMGFLLAGISSYLKVRLLPVSNPTELQFLPQGIALSFYGVAGLL